MSWPRAVIAAPLYNKAGYLSLTLDSILAQDSADFALLLVDDCSTDATPEICQVRAANDERVTYVRNDERLGLTGNRRRCFELGQRLFPASPYFAWGSDHDIWRPRWVSALVGALDDAPEAVLAYPKTVRIDERGAVVKKRSWEFDTHGVESARRRLQLASGGGIGLGDSVYGLYRAVALARAGVVRDVMAPDRLLIAELALQGTFIQVPEVLWERRFRGLASAPRQRASIFPNGAPWHSRLPSWHVHAAIFFGRYAVKGAGRPEIGRARGFLLALEFFRSTAVYRARRSVRKLRRRGRR